MEIWNEFRSLFQHSIFETSLGRIALSVFIITAVMFLRHIFAQMVVGRIRSLAGISRSSLDDRIAEAVAPSIRLLFVVFGFWAGSRILALPDDAIFFINRILRSLGAYSVISALYRFADGSTGLLSEITRRSRTQFDDMLIPFLRKGVKAAIVLLGSIVIIQEWGYDVGGLMAGLGLGGLALALAAKDTAANLFGSVMLMIERPFKIGDWILTPHVEGTVEEIGFRSTKVRTFAQALVTVPNSVMVNDSITNWSRMGKRRITYKIRLRYDTPADDIRELTKRIKQMLIEHTGIHQEMIFVYLTDFDESGLVLFLYFFTKSIVWREYLEVQHDVNLKIMDILGDTGVSIALPSRHLYIEGNDISEVEGRSSE